MVSLMTVTNNLVQSSTKLDTYRRFKQNFELEKYILFAPLGERCKFTKFRISDHHLEIERGRHKRPPIQRFERICKGCDMNRVEDEEHVLMECTKFSTLRGELFEKLENSTSYPFLRTNFDKFNYIMSMAGSDLDLFKFVVPTLMSIMST